MQVFMFKRSYFYPIITAANGLSWNLDLVLIIIQQWKLMNSNIIQSWLILTLSREFHFNSFELIYYTFIKKNHTDRISY